ncbi:MAG TPA: DUF2804 family protein [Solirubrobacteraceae bacterium]|jgi:hypothetical protein|nr:DUF2804 family protein [Solirubrobacteraceae bacterium]
MPSRQGLRPLKAWRYVGVFGPELMLCAAAVRVGPARQTFWAVWDRRTARLYERTTPGRGGVILSPGLLRVADDQITIDLALAETDGIETVCPSGDSYAWTRKQGGVLATGTVTIDGRPTLLQARAVIDDTAGYYERHTRWRWCAGVGRAAAGAELAWNLVEGVNDPPAGSERTIWVDGVGTEPPPQPFAPDLSAVGELRFAAEGVRARTENRLVIRSRYRQPFGTFSGVLPGGITVAEGYGVMEDHDVRW